jgi:hypothetical protein
MKLCEAIAVLKGTKSQTYSLQTEHDKLCQKDTLFKGLTKTYEPIDEEDKDRPDGETVLVQQSADEIVATMTEALAHYFDACATVEVGNTKAVADIEVDGQTVLTNVPVTYLLFLEKQLNDLHTAVGRMPVLSPEFTWHHDAGRNCFVTDELRKVRTKKVPKVVFTATAKTTAKDGSVTEQQQGQVVQEDLPVGYWHTVHFSTALQPARRKQMLARISKLRDAVKQARERGNAVQVEKPAFGKPLLDWVFAE